MLNVQKLFHMNKCIFLSYCRNFHFTTHNVRSFLFPALQNSKKRLQYLKPKIIDLA